MPRPHDRQIDLMLAILEMVRAENPELRDVRLSLRDMADICGCSHMALYHRQRKAIAKLRRARLSRRNSPISKARSTRLQTT